MVLVDDVIEECTVNRISYRYAATAASNIIVNTVPINNSTAGVGQIYTAAFPAGNYCSVIVIDTIVIDIAVAVDGTITNADAAAKYGCIIINKVVFNDRVTDDVKAAATKYSIIISEIIMDVVVANNGSCPILDKDTATANSINKTVTNINALYDGIAATSYPYNTAVFLCI